MEGLSLRLLSRLDLLLWLLVLEGLGLLSLLSLVSSRESLLTVLRELSLLDLGLLILELLLRHLLLDGGDDVVRATIRADPVERLLDLAAALDDELEQVTGRRRLTLGGDKPAA